jgi:hypothetical protein
MMNDEHGNHSVKELLAAYCELRNEQITLVKSADEKIWAKEGGHEEYKKYTFEMLIRHIILHDSFHLYRMEELWMKKERYIKAIE